MTAGVTVAHMLLLMVVVVEALLTRPPAKMVAPTPMSMSPVP
jgi:hypothetical protein